MTTVCVAALALALTPAQTPAIQEAAEARLRAQREEQLRASQKESDAKVREALKAREDLAAQRDKVAQLLRDLEKKIDVLDKQLAELNKARERLEAEGRGRRGPGPDRRPAEGGVRGRPGGEGVEAKLDAILKRLDDFDRRLKKLEERPR
jgi:hypothetical protein